MHSVNGSVYGLEKKSTDDLIAISNSKLLGIISAGSTTTGEDISNQAKIILHKRRPWHEKPWGKVILPVIAGIILMIIGYFVYFVKRYIGK